MVAIAASGSDTYFGKTAQMVSSAESVSHFQKAVPTIGDYLIYLRLFLAAAPWAWLAAKMATAGNSWASCRFTTRRARIRLVGMTGDGVNDVPALKQANTGIAVSDATDVARTKRPILTKPYPAPVLLIAVLLTQAIAAAIVGFGFLVTPIPWMYVGIVWAYCLIWVFIEDWAKLQVYKHLGSSHKHHLKFLGRVQESLHSYSN